MLDVLAVIFGVLFNIRKLDAVSRKNSEFPHVSASDWARWQSHERSVYGTGAWACFLKIFLDLAFTTLLLPRLTVGGDTPAYLPIARIIGASIDLGWIFLVLLTFFRAMGLGKRRRELGIILGGYVTDEPKEKSDGEEEA